MFTLPKQLPEDIEALKGIIVAQEAHINALVEKMRHFQAQLYGKRSEKYIVNEGLQFSLFDEAEVEIQAAVEQEIIVASHKRKKTGRKPLPDDTPRIDVIHDLKDEEKICACGCMMTKIGEEVCEKLDIIPSEMKVIRHIRYKYACKHCEGVESDSSVKTAPLPAQIIPRGIATPGLVAHIITAKFVDGLPFYRQQDVFGRMGVELSRANMANWAIQAADQCKPLMELFINGIRSGPLINIDETTVQVLKEQDRKNTAKSYMWVFRGGSHDHPFIVYQYHPTRSGNVVLDFIGEYEGYVQTDGYSGYDFLKERKVIIHVGCWAHARRKFVEALKGLKSSSEQMSTSAKVAVNYIGKLYAIEKYADENKYTIEQSYKLRQEKAKAVLEEFKDWLDKKSLQTPPGGLLGKAINYTLNQWRSLIAYIETGWIRPDNNLIENNIRPFAVGRKNWLFSGHPRGAEASATLYSLVITAKENGLDPYHYLRFLFENLPYAVTEEGYRKLLPQNVSPELIKAAVFG